MEGSVDYTTLASGEIRLLELGFETHKDPDHAKSLHQDRDVVDVLMPRVSLKAVLLNESLQYHAISYMWGDPEDRKPIVVNGSRVMVTANLRRALEDVMRNMLDDPANGYVLETLPIWADALCINQADNNEKSFQVRMMGEIFAKATRVLVFADQSSPEPGVEKALQILWQLANISHSEDWKDLMESATLNASAYPQTVADRYHAILEPVFNRSVDDVECLYLFAQRRGRWWERAWVVQEVALAKSDQVLIVRGAIFLEWAALVAAHKWYTAEGAAFGFKGRPLLLRNWPPEKIKIWTMVNRSISNISPIFGSLRTLGPGRTLFDHLYWTRLVSENPTKATVPHDIIYSLLSMASDRDICGIVPDYNKSYRELCRDVAVYLLKSRQGAALQCCASREDDAEVPYSWIPNWTRIVRLKPLCFLAYNNDPIYRAGGDKNGWRYRVDGFRLHLLARYVGAVTSIGGLPKAFSKRSVDNPLDFGAARDWLAEYNRFVSAILQLPEERVQSTWRVPIADRDITTINTHDRAASDLQHGYDLLSRPALERDGWYDEVESYAWSLNVTVTYSRGPPAVGREVFALDDGFIGLGPPNVHVGDLVYTIAGHDIPLVLRRAGSGAYRIVGEAFVEGVMDGELAPGDQNHEEITIV